MPSSLSDTLIVLNVENSAHCFDMFGTHPEDPQTGLCAKKKDFCQSLFV
jgi:hypothetical protein